MRRLPMSSHGFSSPVELPCLGPRAGVGAVAVTAVLAGLALAAARVPWLPAAAALGVALFPAAAALARHPGACRLRLAGAGSALVGSGGGPVGVRCTHAWVFGGRVAGLVLATGDGRVSAVYLVRSRCTPAGWRRLRAWLACR